MLLRGIPEIPERERRQWSTRLRLRFRPWDWPWLTGGKREATAAPHWGSSPPQRSNTHEIDNGEDRKVQTPLGVRPRLPEFLTARCSRYFPSSDQPLNNKSGPGWIGQTSKCRSRLARYPWVVSQRLARPARRQISISSGLSSLVALDLPQKGNDMPRNATAHWKP